MTNLILIQPTTSYYQSTKLNLLADSKTATASCFCRNITRGKRFIRCRSIIEVIRNTVGRSKLMLKMLKNILRTLSKKKHCESECHTIVVVICLLVVFTTAEGGNNIMQDKSQNNNALRAELRGNENGRILFINNPRLIHQMYFILHSTQDGIKIYRQDNS